MNTALPRKNRRSSVAAVVLALLVASLVLALPTPAGAQGGCSHSGRTVGDFLAVRVRCSSGPTYSWRNREASALADGSHPSRDSTSPDLHSHRSDQPTLLCAPDAAGRIYCDNGGRAAGFYCPTCQSGPAIQPVILPQVTTGTVLTELRRVGLPSLEAHTQPEVKTLVNFPTIFYTEPQPFSRTVTLLGQVVEIVATPESFTWHFGDGTGARTTTPGAPYPAMDVTHEYTDAHVTVQTSVDVTYSARFSVSGGAWQTIPGAVTISGPAAPLRVVEATAVLSGNYH